jgi:tRNA threonylcarbamoyladenosine biosynthesis protein TsaB
MICLALETTSYTGGVALLDGPRPLAVVEHGTRLDHSRKLLDSIDFALAKSGMTLDQIDAAAVSVGPGSFTGVRIGLTHAKTLAWLRDLPMVGISALDGLACRQPPAKEPVCAMIAARRGEVFAAVYRILDDDLNFEMLTAPCCISLEIALGRISDLLDSTNAACVRFCGNGAERHEEEIIAALGERAALMPPWRRHPSPVAIGLLGMKRLDRGERDEPATLEPFYIRREEMEFRPAPPTIEL